MATNVAQPIDLTATTADSVVRAVKPGSQITFTNTQSDEFPMMQVNFLGSSPNGTDTTFPGEDAVTLTITEEGVFHYMISYLDSTSVLSTGPFAVRSCRAC